MTQALAPREGSEEFQGMVQLHGELWRAVAREAIPAGASVRVTRVEGLTVHVAPAEHRTGVR